MYRNIAVLLGDRITHSNMLDVAINIAKTSDGHITGVYVLPLTSTRIGMPDAVDMEAYVIRSMASK